MTTAEEIYAKMQASIESYDQGAAVAAAEEAGIEVDSHAMSTIMEYQDLIRFEEL